MFIIRGINVFPSQVEDVLMEIEGIEPHYQIVLERKAALDDMEVQIEVDPAAYPDAVRKLVEFERHVEDKLQEELGVRAKVKLVEPAQGASLHGQSPPGHRPAVGRVVELRVGAAGSVELVVTDASTAAAVGSDWYPGSRRRPWWA